MQQKTSTETVTKGFEGSLSANDLRMLAAIRHGLQESVATEVSSEMAKSICGFSLAYLDKLIVTHTEWPSILERQNRRLAETVLGITALLATTNADATLLKGADDTALRAIEASAKSLVNMEQIQRDLDTQLEQLVPMLLRDKQLRAGASLERLNHLLREQIGAIQDSERDVNAAIKARVEEHAALCSNQSQVSLTREKLQHYLRARFPERKNLEITAFRELAGGSSKSTILIDVRDFENEGTSSLVARIDRVAGSTDTRVIDEVPTLQMMFAQGLPVPEIVMVEPDPAKVGLAFMLVRNVDAQLGGSIWQADPQICNADTARDLARILARIHSLDTIKLGLRGALNSDPGVHPMQGLIDHMRGLWAIKKMAPDGTLESCLCWLEQHMPPAPAQPSLVHGDVAFHNILVKDKKIAALLDWELSHLGDPIEDLSYCRMCVEHLIPWDEFIAEYQRHGGGEYSEETGRYYGIWRGVRNAVYALVSHHSFHTGANLDLRWGGFGAYYRLVLLEAADKVAQAGMVGPE